MEVEYEERGVSWTTRKKNLSEQEKGPTTNQGHDLIALNFTLIVHFSLCLSFRQTTLTFEYSLTVLVSLGGLSRGWGRVAWKIDRYCFRIKMKKEILKITGTYKTKSYTLSTKLCACLDKKIHWKIQIYLWFNLLKRLATTLIYLLYLSN